MKRGPLSWCVSLYICPAQAVPCPPCPELCAQCHRVRRHPGLCGGRQGQVLFPRPQQDVQVGHEEGREATQQWLRALLNLWSDLFLIQRGVGVCHRSHSPPAQSLWGRLTSAPSSPSLDSNEGQVTKTLRIAPGRDSGYFFSLSVKNQGQQSQFNVPLSGAEVRVVRSIIEVRSQGLAHVARRRPVHGWGSATGKTSIANTPAD